MNAHSALAELDQEIARARREVERCDGAYQDELTALARSAIGFPVPAPYAAQQMGVIIDNPADSEVLRQTAEKARTRLADLQSRRPRLLVETL